MQEEPLSNGPDVPLRREAATRALTVRAPRTPPLRHDASVKGGTGQDLRPQRFPEKEEGTEMEVVVGCRLGTGDGFSIQHSICVD